MAHRATRWVGLAAVLGLAGCWGRGFSYEGGSGGTGSDTQPPTTAPQECGEDVDTSDGYRLEGQLVDLQIDAPLDQPLCITAIDPTPAVTGGEPTTLGSARVCDGGEFIVANLQEAPTIGLFVVVDDCEGEALADTADPEADLVYKTATGLSGDDIAGLGDGDALTGIDALVISSEYMATIQADAEAAGYTGDPLAEAGFMAGFALDSSESPVSGAEIVAGCCPNVYYADDDPKDGLFTTGGQVNSSTSAEADALWLVPAAPVFTYECVDDGSHTWEPSLYGSLPGYGVLIRFVAQ